MPRIALIFVAFALGTFAHRAQAFEFYWQAVADAPYSSASNWDRPGGPPGIPDRAIFDRIGRGLAGGAAVNFNTNPTNERLLVLDDDVTFRMAGRSYTLTNSLPTAPSVVVAQVSGEIADLRIEGTGTLNAVYATLGLGAGSDGIVEVSNATWNNSQTLLVGGSGAGEILIEAAGQVRAHTSTLANNGDSSFGKVTVTGANSRFTNTEYLVVGNAGYAEFDVLAGGVATNSFAILGADATSTGLATISDTGSRWDNSLDLTVAEAGYAELNIFDAGVVTSVGAVIARHATSTGTVTVYDGTWDNVGDMHIGGSDAGPGGTGTLIVDFGAEVSTTGTTRVHEGGLLSIRGGTFQTGSLENNGGIEYLLGVLHLTNSDLVIGDTGIIGPVLALTPDMHTIVDQHTTVESNGHIAAVEGLYTTNTMTNHGRLSIIDAAMDFIGASTNTSTGRISIINGTLATGTGAARLVNQGRMDFIDATVNGDLHNAAGSIVNTGGGVMFSGLVSGAASFSGSGHLTFAGGFKPGDSAAQIEIGGDVSFVAGKTLSMQLGGTVAGSQYDQLSVDGAAAFAGRLDVTLFGGFIPAAGQSFDLLTYAVHSGTFSTVTLPTLTGSLTWDLDYGDTSLTLSVIGSTLTGDLNHDTFVNVADVAILAGNFGKKTSVVADDGDLNGDGVVSLRDLLLLQTHLGQGPGGSPAAVPEPSMLVLALTAVTVLVVRRRIKR